jgi:hypothetical protein
MSQSTHVMSVLFDSDGYMMCFTRRPPVVITVKRVKRPQVLQREENALVLPPVIEKNLDIKATPVCMASLEQYHCISLRH